MARKKSIVKNRGATLGYKPGMEDSIRLAFEKENNPNAGRLVESMRFLGYGNYEAVADLVDNSIDAGASKIWINYKRLDKALQLSISDNGSGMDKATLDQAMRLGSMTERDLESDLGRFGMGLVTASLSIAKRCHLVTRGSEGTLSSAWDVDEIVEQNAFVKHLEEAGPDEEAMLNEFVPKGTGTMILLTKCDNISNRSTTTFAEILRKHLGRVHRNFIRSGLEIYVNGAKTDALDPLQTSDKNTKIVMDEAIPISLKDDDGNSVEASVQIKIALVPDESESALDVGKSLKSQGFYVMRNDREIVAAEHLNLFTKHPDFNRMRGEVTFPGTLDRFFGVEFTKRQVHLHEDLFTQLAAVLIPTCKTIKKSEVARRRTTQSGQAGEQHKKSEAVVSGKQQSLILPPSKPLPENAGRAEALEHTFHCEFTESALGNSGPIYEASMMGSKMTITYNIEHPFYQKMVLDHVEGDQRMVTVADHIVFAMATAELTATNDKNEALVNNFKAVFSGNLRTLLG